MSTHQAQILHRLETGLSKNKEEASPASSCSPSVEEWWTTHAALLAEKMKLGGVQDFRISLTDRGTYKFEVNPISEANAGDQERL